MLHSSTLYNDTSKINPKTCVLYTLSKRCIKCFSCGTVYIECRFLDLTRFLYAEWRNLCFLYQHIGIISCFGCSPHIFLSVLSHRNPDSLECCLDKVATNSSMYQVMKPYQAVHENTAPPYKWGLVSGISSFCVAWFFSVDSTYGAIVTPIEAATCSTQWFRDEWQISAYSPSVYIDCLLSCKLHVLEQSDHENDPAAWPFRYIRGNCIWSRKYVNSDKTTASLAQKPNKCWGPSILLVSEAVSLQSQSSWIS